MAKRPPISTSTALKTATSAARSVAGAPPPGPQWKPTQRAALAGSRRPHPHDPAPPPRTRDEGWARLLEVERAEDALCQPVKLQNESAEALYEPIRASYARGEPPIGLTPEVERLRADLLHTHPVQREVDAAWQALLPFWIGTEGLGFVLDVCSASEPWSYMTSGLTRILIGPPQARDTRGHGWGRAGGTHFLKELRRLLFALPEPEFLEARDEGGAWLSRRSADGEAHERVRERVAIAYALARDPTLAEEITREVLDGRTHVSDPGHLLASITDLSLARAFVDRYAMSLDTHGALVALDVVETFGCDAAGLMQKILDAAGGRARPLKAFYRGRLEAARKLALTDPRPPTP